ncbi:Uma2 family endonuclease [soil metagenome]
MATASTTGLTYDQLRRFPDDNLRREIIGGELFVTPAPSTRHQRVVVRLVLSLGAYARDHGGEVLPAPTDVFFTDTDVVEPDVLFVTDEHRVRVEELFVRGSPDLVVEVSSPSTRRVDSTRKRDLYERFGVAEYWLIDLDADRVEVHRLGEPGYGPPQIIGRGGVLASQTLPGLRIEVRDVLAAWAS